MKQNRDSTLCSPFPCILAAIHEPSSHVAKQPKVMRGKYAAPKYGPADKSLRPGFLEQVGTSPTVQDLALDGVFLFYRLVLSEYSKFDAAV